MDKILLDGVGQLVNVQAACRGIDDVLVDAALVIQAVGIATLLHASVLQGIDQVGVNDLRDGV